MIPNEPMLSFSDERRGQVAVDFLGGAGLATMCAAVGGTIPYSDDMPAGLIPVAMAQSAAPPPASAPAAPKAPQFLKFPGKNEKLVYSARSRSWAETPQSLLDDATTPIDKFHIRNNGQIPEETRRRWWKITIDGEVNQKLELTVGELKAKFKPVTRRMVLECGGNGRSFFTPQAREPMDQWRCGLRGMDRRTRGRCASRQRGKALRYL